MEKYNQYIDNQCEILKLIFEKTKLEKHIQQIQDFIHQDGIKSNCWKDITKEIAG